MRGIRGAITVEENTIPAIAQAVVELVTAVQERNRFQPADVCSAVFTVTPDLDAVFPSLIARKSFAGWEHVAFLDLAHLPVQGSLPRCIRLLITLNTDRPQHELRHAYLRDACGLRPDLP